MVVDWSGSTTGGEGPGRVKLHDILSGTTTPLSRQGIPAGSPAVGGGLVAWTEGEGPEAEIIMRDLGSGATYNLSLNDVADDGPVVADGLVAWTQVRGGNGAEVVVYDAVTDESHRLTSNFQWDEVAATSSGWIYWTEGSNELMTRLRSSGPTLRLTDDVTADNPWGVTADGGRVAWLSRQGLGQTGDMWLYTAYGQRRQRLSVGGDAAETPALDQGMVAWREVTAGWSGIVLHDPANPAVERVSEGGTDARFPSMDGGLLVWATREPGHQGIRLLTRDSFPDVPWYYLHGSAIGELARRHVIDGYGDGSFRPADPVLRQHFAKMIVLSLQLPVSEADVCPFSDVDEGGPGMLYPDNYVAVAAARGITHGIGGGRFAPFAEISRAQAITMVVRAAEDADPGRLQTLPAGYAGTWGDFSSTHAANAATAEYNHLLDGVRLRGVDPWGDMTRGEVAQVLHNLVYVMELYPPVDQARGRRRSGTRTLRRVRLSGGLSIRLPGLILPQM